MKTYIRTVVLLGILAISTSASAKDNPEQFIGLMSQYLGLANQVVDTASRPEATAFLAIEGIFEIYEQRRKTELSLMARGIYRHAARESASRI